MSSRLFARFSKKVGANKQTQNLMSLISIARSLTGGKSGFESIELLIGNIKIRVTCILVKTSNRTLYIPVYNGV